MYYLIETKKPFHQASTDLEAAVQRHGFGVLNVHDLGATLRSKGVPFDEECRVFEVCNSRQTARVLSADMRLNSMLPCRISVFTNHGKTEIGMIRATETMASLSQEPNLQEIAEQVEAKTIQMIDEAK